MKGLVLALLSVGILFQAGCDKSGSSAAKAKSDVTMVVVLNKDVSGESKTESVNTTEGVTIEEVEGKFNSLPWTDPQFSPYVGLARTPSQGVSSLNIRRPVNSQSSAGMQSIWMSNEGGKGVERLSEVFDSKEKAVKLLRAFFSKDVSLSSIANWTKTEA